MYSDSDEIPNPEAIKNMSLKKNMEYFYKNFLSISLTFLINMKHLGKAQGYVKKNF